LTIIGALKIPRSIFNSLHNIYNGWKDNEEDIEDEEDG